MEDNEDPLKIGRLKVRVPSYLGKNQKYQQINYLNDPNFPYGGSMMLILCSRKDATVNVLSLGRFHKPVWIGCNYSQFETYGTPKPPGETNE